MSIMEGKMQDLYDASDNAEKVMFELVDELVNKKALENNTIDLDAYAKGLVDMYCEVVLIKRR